MIESKPRIGATAPEERDQDGYTEFDRIFEAWRDRETDAHMSGRPRPAPILLKKPDSGASPRRRKSKRKR